MEYLYIDIKLNPFSDDEADILCALLGEIGFESFEYTQNGLKAYIQAANYESSTIEALLNGNTLPGINIKYSTHKLENKDWNEVWEQESFDPVLERDFGIKLNPRMAFGSGSHETTYQLTELICTARSNPDPRISELMNMQDKSVLDMGCGTGVLGIAAALHGASFVEAIDIDEMSVANTYDNFLLNCLADPGKIKIVHGDASAIEGAFDTIMANIHKNIIINDMRQYIEHLNTKGTMVLSGFYSTDVEDIARHLNQQGMNVIHVQSRAEWAVVIAQKTN